MSRNAPTQFALLALVTLWSLAGCGSANRPLSAETAMIEQWRAARAKNLTSPTGWLSLNGLYWLQPGDNRFGRASDNQLVLNHSELAEHAGNFRLGDQQVTFIAAPDAGITHDAQVVTAMLMTPDNAGAATILSSGSLQFHVIERAGHFGVRVRDLEHPARRQFAGLNYYPIDMSWRIRAHFIPYQPAKPVPIVNIIGLTENMLSPGAIEFERDGKTWRLDTLLESPTDTELFVMFKDATNGAHSYGAGRFLYIDLPQHNRVWVDFNQAYSPPCAFTEFATCPLPPAQNRLALAITAGELKYGAH